eukprot:tig00000093_g3668.t1
MPNESFGFLPPLVTGTIGAGIGLGISLTCLWLDINILKKPLLTPIPMLLSAFFAWLAWDQLQILRQDYRRLARDDMSNAREKERFTELLSWREMGYTGCGGAALSGLSSLTIYNAGFSFHITAILAPFTLFAGGGIPTWILTKQWR